MQGLELPSSARLEGAPSLQVIVFPPGEVSNDIQGVEVILTHELNLMSYSHALWRPIVPQFRFAGPLAFGKP